MLIHRVRQPASACDCPRHRPFDQNMCSVPCWAMAWRRASAGCATPAGWEPQEGVLASRLFQRPPVCAKRERARGCRGAAPLPAGCTATV